MPRWTMFLKNWRVYLYASLALLTKGLVELKEIVLLDKELVVSKIASQSTCFVVPGIASQGTLFAVPKIASLGMGLAALAIAS